MDGSGYIQINEQGGRVMKKLWLSSLCFLFLMLPAVCVHASYMEVNISGTDSIVFNSRKDSETCYVHKDGEWADFTSSVSSNEKVATTFVTAEEDRVLIDAAGRGSCIVTITDKNNRKKDIKITVTDAYAISVIIDETRLDNCWYGTKKIIIDTVPKCSGTLKIRKDTYKFSVGSSGTKTIKLKRVYKLNEKVKLTLKKDDLMCNMEDYFGSGTFSCSISGGKKKIKVEISNLHKGDIVYVKHRGKTYKQTIKKDYDGKTKYITFKTKKTVRKDGEKIVVTVKNKSKKLLDKTTFVLAGGGDDIYKNEADMS